MTGDGKQNELPSLAEQLVLPALCAALRAWERVLQQQHQDVDRSKRPVQGVTTDTSQASSLELHYTCLLHAHVNVHKRDEVN